MLYLIYGSTELTKHIFLRFRNIERLLHLLLFLIRPRIGEDKSLAASIRSRRPREGLDDEPRGLAKARAVSLAEARSKVSRPYSQVIAFHLHQVITLECLNRGIVVMVTSVSSLFKIVVKANSLSSLLKIVVTVTSVQSLLKMTSQSPVCRQC